MIVFNFTIPLRLLIQEWYWGLLFCVLKGYLRCKTISSQNVPSEAQIKNFQRKIMFCSQDIKVFVFLTIPWYKESVTSRWVLAHETRYIFKYVFWTTTHEVTKRSQLIDISKGNNFLETFEHFVRLALGSRFFSI